MAPGEAQGLPHTSEPAEPSETEEREFSFCSDEIWILWKYKIGQIKEKGSYVTEEFDLKVSYNYVFFFLPAAVITLLDITKLYNEITSRGHLIFKIKFGLSHLSILLGYQTQYYRCLFALLPSPFIVCVIGKNKYNCAFVVWS